MTSAVKRYCGWSEISRSNLDWRKGTQSAGDGLEAELRADSDTCLDVVDYLLHATAYRTPSTAGTLETILQQGGSAWRVAKDGDGFSLQRRVEQAVQAAVESLLSGGGRAAEHLAAAWSAVYGRSPNPSDGYGESIKAVEAAAQPVVSPANPRATLGTMLADLRNKPSKWSLAFREHPSIDPVVSLIAAMWKGQFDRHGTADSDVPIAVSQEEAEAAVHAAALLVRWFTSGAVARVAPS
jgi:hypothetical protein